MLYSLQYEESCKPDPHATAALISLALEFPNANHCMYTPFSYGIFFLVFVVLSTTYTAELALVSSMGCCCHHLGRRKIFFFTMFCILCVPICKVWGTLIRTPYNADCIERNTYVVYFWSTIVHYMQGEM